MVIYSRVLPSQVPRETTCVPSLTASQLPGLSVSTQKIRRWFSKRATGLSWNVTFSDAVEKVRDGVGGRSRVVITDLCKVLAERMHPKVAS